MDNPREEINGLEKIKEAKIKAICDEYDRLIAKYYHQFTLQEILDLGWVRDSFYGPGSSERYGKEYLYRKRNKFIRVNEKTLAVNTYSGEQHFAFCSIEELKTYGNA